MRKLWILPIILFLYSCQSSRTTTSSSPSQNNYTAKPSVSSPSISPKKIDNVIHSARQYLGTPYKYAGMDRKGMDCSGLMCMAFKDIGVVLPHQASEQSKLGQSIKLKDLQPGDLVFIGATKGSDKITHVGMVVTVDKGKIMFIHASTKRGVVEENLLEKWYEPLFIKGARLF